MNVADFRRRRELLLLPKLPLWLWMAVVEPLAPASFADAAGPRIWYEVQACVLAAELTQEPVVTVDCWTLLLELRLSRLAGFDDCDTWK